MCRTWGSVAEESAPSGAGVEKLEFSGLAPADGSSVHRFPSGIGEFDRVCGGGLVSGSAILLSGAPGVGKSTFLLQLLVSLESRLGRSCASYISGEESLDQIRLRARRLGVEKAGIRLAGEVRTESIGSALDTSDGCRVAVIDSIQTLRLERLDSAAGTVAQIRESVQFLTRIAKRRGFSIVFVAHITKEGLIAGPKSVEHMVDAVFSLESDTGQPLRILRASKNRFGPTSEMGVFEMSGCGLREVSNPSTLFLDARREKKVGAAVFAGTVGSRPFLVELQALVAPSKLALPRRAAVGWDLGRLAMLLAVLEARCGLSFGPCEVYLNVAGGLRIGEPAADLAAVAALVSARLEREIAAEMVFFGEVGLSGELRPVPHCDLRLREAVKLGFQQAVLPLGSKKADIPKELTVLEMRNLRDLLEWLGWRRNRSVMHSNVPTSSRRSVRGV